MLGKKPYLQNLFSLDLNKQFIEANELLFIEIR